MKTKRFRFLLVVVFATMLLVACGAPTAAPTATPIPPTEPPPTATPIPPTNTPVPPTATPIPPTDTPVPPEPEAPEFFSGFADNDGVSIHYEVEGEGPPLMIANWWTGSTEDWRMFGYVDGMKDDYQLILVDMRGHGQSDKPHEPGSYDPEIVASDIISVLDELDIDKTHYFGHSLGAMVGWSLAKYAPERFHSFILSGVGPSGWDTERASGYADFLMSHDADAWARSFEETTKAQGVWTPEIYDAYADVDIEAGALAIKEISSFNVKDDLANMQVPFLLIGVPTDADYPTVLAAMDVLPDAKLYVSEKDHGETGVRSDLLLPHMTEFLEEVSAETAAEPSEVISGYADNDGVRIHYEVEGEGPPLVLVPWFTGSTEDWRMFGYVDALKDDYQLILVDMRGHGLSDKPHDADVYDPETQVADVIAVLDELGIDKAHFYGYSLGGTLGWALAQQAPERFHSVMIGAASPAAHDGSDFAEMVLSESNESWAKAMEDRGRRDNVWHPGIYDSYIDIDREALALATMGLNVVDAEADLQDMEIPILLLAGTEDWEYEAMVEAAERLPNAQLAAIQGLSHSQSFLKADQALPHITDFLAEQGAESESPAAKLDSETVDHIEMATKIMMAKDDVPGLAIGIVKDGEVVYAEGFGDANIESGIPVTSQSLFNMAQVSMMFTSAAIMQLVEQGLIDLDAPVTDYLSYFKLDDPHFTEITVRQLLDSTSGLPDTSVEKDVSWKNRNYDDPDNEEGALERFVRSLDGLALIAEPGGSDMLYSSMGYDILGDIVAKVSGQSYETYMQENILDPLGMDHSTFMLDEADAELLTAGHRGDVASPEVEEWEFFPFNMQHSPSNGLIANVDDMNKWALAFLNGGELDGTHILETESLDEIWSPSSTMDWGGAFPGLWHGLDAG